MRIYYDTEFTSLDGNVDGDMISAGFVTDDGREWYAEITDFNRNECSPFVVETVLPLLGRVPAEHMSGDHFDARFAHWLASFEEDIELVSDSGCDWFLVNGMAYLALQELPRRVQGRVWQRTDDVVVLAELDQIEASFWLANPGMQHHALLDARRLKMIADSQRTLLTT